MIPSADRWISEEFQRLAEIVQDYDHNLELRWIPPEKREDLIDKSKPFVVWDTSVNKPVFFCSEADTPVGILERLFKADNTKHDVLSNLEAHNAAVAAMKLKERMDKQEEDRDFAAFAIRNRRNYWKHKGTKYDSEMREIK